MSRLLALPAQAALIVVGAVMLLAFFALALTTALYERLGGKI